MYAIIEIRAGGPRAFGDVFAPDDLWEKIRGCEGCPEANKCCSSCPVRTELGCQYNLERAAVKNKPFMCMVMPTPEMCQSWCQLEFKCVKGSRLGQVRRVRDLRDIFVE